MYNLSSTRFSHVTPYETYTIATDTLHSHIITLKDGIVVYRGHPSYDYAKAWIDAKIERKRKK